MISRTQQADFTKYYFWKAQHPSMLNISEVYLNEAVKGDNWQKRKLTLFAQKIILTAKRKWHIPHFQWEEIAYTLGYEDLLAYFNNYLEKTGIYNIQHSPTYDYRPVCNRYTESENIFQYPKLNDCFTWLCGRFNISRQQTVLQLKSSERKCN